MLYGRGAAAIAEQIGTTTEEAQKIKDKFFKAFPKVEKWMKGTIARAKETGYVETVCGRKRRLPDIQLPKYSITSLKDKNKEIDEETKRRYIRQLKQARGKVERDKIILGAKALGILIKDNSGIIAEAERQAINSVIQGTAADMTKRAMIKIYHDPVLKSYDFRLLLQVHDEVIGECKEEFASQCKAQLSKLMIETAAEIVSVPMKCDPSCTYCWYGEELDV